MSPKSQSVPSSEEIRHTLLTKFEEHRKLVIGVGAVLVVVVVGIILYVTLSRQAFEEHWSTLLSVDRSSPLGAEETLQKLIDTGGSDIAPIAIYKLAVIAARDKDYDRAVELLDHLEKKHGDTLFTVLPSPISQYSLPDLLRRRIESDRTWSETHSMETPDPDLSRVALVETSKGAFWIAFYPELAPEHVKSFVGLAKAGALNGTKVYVVAQNRVEFGGAATRDDDPFNDTETVETKLLDPEPGRFKISQDRGAVSAVAVEGGESPTRIAIVVGMSDLGLEKKQTVFGKVLTDRVPEMSALDEIKNVTTYGTSKDPAHRGDEYREIPDRPIEAVAIERVSIWAGDAIEDGHEWDTSTVKKPVKETPKEPAEDEKKDESSEEKGGSPTEDDKAEDE